MAKKTTTFSFKKFAAWTAAGYFAALHAGPDTWVGDAFDNIIGGNDYAFCVKSVFRNSTEHEKYGPLNRALLAAASRAVCDEYTKRNP